MYDVDIKVAPDFKAKENRSGDILKKTFKDEFMTYMEPEIKTTLAKFGCRDINLRRTGEYVFDISYKTDQQDAIRILFSDKPLLTFRFVDDRFTDKAMKWYMDKFQGKQIPDDRVKQNELLTLIASSIKLPDDREVLFEDKLDKNGMALPSGVIVVFKEALMREDHIKTIDTDKDGYGRTNLVFRTRPDGALIFSEITGEENHGRKLAVVFNNHVKFAAVIDNTIGSGVGNICGAFSKEEIDLIVFIFKKNIMRIDMNILEEKVTPFAE